MTTLSAPKRTDADIVTLRSLIAKELKDRAGPR